MTTVIKRRASNFKVLKGETNKFNSFDKASCLSGNSDFPASTSDVGIKNLTNLIDSIVDATMEIAKALGNMLWEMVKKTIEEAINPLLYPVLEKISDYRSDVWADWIDICQEYNETGSISKASLKAFDETLKSSIYYPISALSVAVVAFQQL